MSIPWCPRSMSFLHKKKSQLKNPIQHDLYSKRNSLFKESVREFIMYVTYDNILPNLPPITDYKSLLHCRWCALKMAILEDLTKNDILPGSLVSHFFNTETHRNLILQYIKSRVLATPHATYLAFDLKFSMQEHFSTKSFNPISKCQSIVWRNLEILLTDNLHHWILAFSSV
jgi:hypothetical protein